MNLSHKLTFSIFSFLLVAALMVVPTSVMAAEGGPEISTIALDESLTEPASGAGVATSSKGNALLTATVNRAALHDLATGNGFFRMIVTFDEDVYATNAARPGNSAAQIASRRLTVGDLNAALIEVIGAVNIKTGATIPLNRFSVTTARKVKTRGVGGAPDVYEPRMFYVNVEVNAALIFGTRAALPIRIALKVKVGGSSDGRGGTTAVYGIGQNAGLDPQGNVRPDTPGIANEASAPKNVTVVPRALSNLAVTGKPGRSIRSHETINLTLTFTPELHDDDVPTRQNIVVTGGAIKTDKPDTDDDDGLNKTSSDNTVWDLVIVPEGGIGDTGTITVKSRNGTSFILNETFTVNNLPEAQRVTITGPIPKLPDDGAIFTANIVYNVAPATPLTVAGITVTNGSIVANSFSGSGKSYSVRIDPNNPTATNPVTVTVRVGQDFATFTTSVAGTTPTTTPGDVNEAIIVPIANAIPAKGYLVVSPVLILYKSDVAPIVAADLNADVLPRVLGASGTFGNVSTAAKIESVRVSATQNMPDLEDLLYEGGTIDVYVKSASGAADIIINEVMWALDENEIGAVGATAHQWIELYNNSDTVAAAGTIRLRFKPRALDAPSTADLDTLGTRTDRLSNVVRFGTTTGWRLGTNHGQSGNSHAESTKEFISMYRKGDKRGDNDGINGANWLPSTTLSHTKHRGTPGEANVRTQVAVETRPAPRVYTPPKSHVIINEVYNDSNNDLDWLELRFLKKTNVENWTLSYAKKDFTEAEIMRFPKREFQANDIVLIVNKNPGETGVKLAAGQDVTLGAANQARGAGPHKYWNPSGGNSGSGHYLDIPDYNGGDYLLILRTGKGWERFRSGDRIHDVVGTGTFVKQTLNANTVEREPHTQNPNDGKKGYIWNTRVWPLNGQNLGDDHKDQNQGLLQNDRKLVTGRVWARNGTHDGWKKNGIYDPGNRGGLGYGRNVVANGTPGYPNDIVKAKHTDLASGKVVVSELMLTTDSSRYPQWIELHNTSKTNTVDLHADTDGNGARQGWSIRVENNRSDSWDTRRRDKLNVEVKFRDLGVRFIPPNQTILITADKVRNSNASHFPDSRVASIWGTGAKGVFKMNNRRDIFLNPKGFLLEVVDGSGQVSDAVGNLDGKSPTLFNDVGFDKPYSWEWPSQDALIINNRRTSLIRLYEDGVARAGTPDRMVANSTRGAVLPLNIDKIWLGKGKKVDGKHTGQNVKYAGYAWVHASDTKLAKAQVTWYGSDKDYGTPLHTTGTPLPVSLSFFRPTLEDGKIIIRWTTESELDNAGFNIYRSDSALGEFKQVNEQMIQGNGTTAERSSYKWSDVSAKPGVVYYYQIEDVSLAGERTLLATTRLKGLVSAKGKLTTQWGALKNLR